MVRCYHCMEMIEDPAAICPHCGFNPAAAQPEPDQLLQGTVLEERYLIGYALGRGGFGVTYLAWDRNLERKVAIKEYLPRGMATRAPGTASITCDKVTEQMFRKGAARTIEESKRLALFDLDTIVTVFDWFRANGTAYIVMELLHGRTVKAALAEHGVFSYAKTAEIMMPVLDTLAVVHKEGLIHRDISPDNIFLCDDGRVKLLDFGAARATERESPESSSIVLKHGYAPIEQYSHSNSQDARIDVYACCATMYKMLTGVTPLPSVDRIDDPDRLIPLSQCDCTDLPGAVADVIMHGLSVRATDRPASASDLAKMLTAAQNESVLPTNSEATVTMYEPRNVPEDEESEPISDLGTDQHAPQDVPPEETPARDPSALKKLLIPILAAVAAIAVAVPLLLHGRTVRLQAEQRAAASRLAAQTAQVISTTTPTTTAAPTTTEPTTEAPPTDEELYAAAFKKKLPKVCFSDFDSLDGWVSSGDEPTRLQFVEMIEPSIVDLNNDGIKECILFSRYRCDGFYSDNKPNDHIIRMHLLTLKDGSVKCVHSSQIFFQHRTSDRFSLIRDVDNQYKLVFWYWCTGGGDRARASTFFTFNGASLKFVSSCASWEQSYGTIVRHDPFYFISETYDFVDKDSKNYYPIFQELDDAEEFDEDGNALKYYCPDSLESMAVNDYDFFCLINKIVEDNEQNGCETICSSAKCFDIIEKENN